MSGAVFCFGDFRLHVRERFLIRDEARVNIGSRAFDLLLALVRRAGETVYRDELFNAVWPDVFVGKGNLRVHVSGLRKALGDGTDGNRFIVCVAGRGYRFVAAVTHDGADKSVASSSVPFESRLGRAAVVDCGAIDPNINNSAQIAISMASALGFEVKLQESLTSVLTYLQDKEILLVFDNCDHIFANVSQLTERLFSEAPGVRVLISSRNALGMYVGTPAVCKPEALKISLS